MRIAHARPALERRIEREALADADPLALGVERLGAERALHQRHGGGDDEGRWGGVGGMQRSQRSDAGVERRRFQRQPLVRRHLRLGKVVDGGVVAAVGLDTLEQLPRVLGPRADDEEGPPALVPERGDDVGLGSLQHGGAGGLGGAGREPRTQFAVGVHAVQSLEEAMQPAHVLHADSPPANPGGRARRKGV